MMWPALIFFLISYIQSCLSEECPFEGDIVSCRCTTADVGLNVRCSNIKSLEGLRSTVDGFRGRKIHHFEIKDSTFEYVPFDLFENVTVNELSFSNSNFSMIDKLGDPQLKGLENSLETLRFTNTFSKLNPLAYVSMETLTKLTTLELRNSYVNVVHNLWFKNGPNSLRIIRFVKGDIRAVGYNAFNSLTNLRIIDLSDNQLTYIPRGAFPEPATYLTEINLERNKLQTITEDFFTEMPNLEKVNLELNELITIDEKTWRPVWDNLEYLNIDYNPMICDQKLKWIFDKANLEYKLIGLCYKPFKLMDREIHSLKPEELN